MSSADRPTGPDPERAEGASRGPDGPGPVATDGPGPVATGGEPVVSGASDGGGPAGDGGERLRLVSVSDVRLAVPATPGVEAGMVTLREEDPPYRAVSIVIGQPEARAIQAAWSGQAQRRPSTWDLFVSAVGVLGGRLERVVITAVEERRHFFAHVELSRDGQCQVLAARPSDAVALALRSYGAAIYVAEQVFADLGLGEPPVDN